MTVGRDDSPAEEDHDLFRQLEDEIAADRRQTRRVVVYVDLLEHTGRRDEPTWRALGCCVALTVLVAVLVVVAAASGSTFCTALVAAAVPGVLVPLYWDDPRLIWWRALLSAWRS